MEANGEKISCIMDAYGMYDIVFLQSGTNGKSTDDRVTGDCVGNI